MYIDIACVAAPCICPPGARANVDPLFRDRPLTFGRCGSVSLENDHAQTWNYPDPAPFGASTRSLYSPDEEE
jgi:hypothetical protein